MGSHGIWKIELQIQLCSIQNEYWKGKESTWLYNCYVTYGSSCRFILGFIIFFVQKRPKNCGQIGAVSVSLFTVRLRSKYKNKTPPKCRKLLPFLSWIIHGLKKAQKISTFQKRAERKVKANSRVPWNHDNKCICSPFYNGCIVTFTND